MPTSSQKPQTQIKIQPHATGSQSALPKVDDEDGSDAEEGQSQQPAKPVKQAAFQPKPQ